MISPGFFILILFKLLKTYGISWRSFVRFIIIRFTNFEMYVREFAKFAGGKVKLENR